MIPVKNIHSELKPFVVATISSYDELWFYGSYDTKGEAVKVSLEIENAVVLDREKVKKVD